MNDKYWYLIASQASTPLETNFKKAAATGESEVQVITTF